ncbi:sucrose synthase [Aeoliella mucimassa]|uniref:Sucrose synthase n=1 Tax=Aeoliella mucimassa TaxID=2527972 RepID=A0A518AIG6_9BACT|nr:sucrose synthase [Aeoliella mucimassa]QDU54519.1 Mannosylfructose-phosphate synthase [Aeoliella mucimassa]
MPSTSTLQQEMENKQPQPNGTSPPTGNGGNGQDAFLTTRDLSSFGAPFGRIKKFAATLKATGEPLFLADQIQEHLEAFLENEQDLTPRDAKAIRRVFRGCSEIVLEADSAYALLRPGIGLKQIVCIHPEFDKFEEVDRGKFLEIKDSQIQGYDEASKRGLVLDFSPYFRDYPKVLRPQEMGEGIALLNRRLASQLNGQPGVFRQGLLGFLRNRKLDGVSILVNEHLSSPEVLLKELPVVLSLLEDYDNDEPYAEVAHELRTHGFEPGWGSTVGRIAESLDLLQQVLESSEPAQFAELLTRLPLIRTVLMVSPHGWFAQDGVLGKPDTGGQVTYVLDQALAMEQELRKQFELSGVSATPKIAILTRQIPNAEGTTCNMVREKIHGSEDSWIIRAPFRDMQGEVLNDWISRFRIWPYLEAYAEESKQLVVTEMLGPPDLIIGHYTDGNLVASRLADDLNTTHCACIHALEKTKYLLSDMHWEGFEKDYAFSMQFTADLIAYNSADFIVSSSYREVGGTDTEMGMIESYELFSMPGLYRVQSGFDPRLARHNIVPPGASPKYFFPNTDHGQRIDAVTQSLSERFMQAQPAEGDVGVLDHPERPIVFAMARMDKIKNLSGLVEIFGKHEKLRDSANLLLVTSLNNAELSSDHEEIEEVNRTYELIEKYSLNGHIRWCAARLDKVETGEVYRIVADRGGVFAQPAFMETFGLTVIEAMACGLPVVVTCFGGPSEIVVPAESGEVINPNHQEEFAEALYRTISDTDRWSAYSTGGIARVEEKFTWKQHAKRVTGLANVYSYWNHLDVMNRQALDRYIHTLYHTVYRPRTQSLL